MKKPITFFLVIMAIAVALIVTKPTDEQCIDLMKSKVQTAIANSTTNSFFTIRNTIDKRYNNV